MKRTINLSHIQHIRSQNVMLDTHVAEIFSMELSELRKLIKRKQHLFPEHALFQLTEAETKRTKRQKIIPANRRAKPYAFSVFGICLIATMIDDYQARSILLLLVRFFVSMRPNQHLHPPAAKQIERTERNELLDLYTPYNYIQFLTDIPIESKEAQ